MSLCIESLIDYFKIKYRLLILILSIMIFKNWKSDDWIAWILAGFVLLPFLIYFCHYLYITCDAVVLALPISFTSLIAIGFITAPFSIRH